MCPDKKTTVHIVSHTHWDREWRWPIWTTRFHLVRFFRELMALLERDPDYCHFTLDGQSIMVEDYLESCPEDRDRIRKLVQDGRLSIGPWYTLPDPWPVSGECLVRNLLRGRRTCEPLGGTLDVGYTTFGWGQPAQIPQIYADFGIDSIVTAKHVGKARAPHSEFIWQAPDGTRVFTTRLGDLGRANFFKRGLLKVLYGDEYWTDEWCYEWGDGELVVHRADRDGCWRDYQLIRDQPPCHPELLKVAFEAAYATTADSLSDTDRFFGDGCDYTGGLESLPRLIREANQLFDDREFVHSSIPRYMARLRASIDPEKLRTVEGELRDPPVTAFQGNAMATRLYLKQHNRVAQTELIHVAEPLAAMATMLGEPYPTRFIETAWKYLLLCHSHDAINGVTVDKISEDVMHRLRQVREIADVVTTESMTRIVQQIDLSDYSDDDVLLVAFNSLPFPRRETLLVTVDTPRAADVDRFRIENAAGERMRVQFVDRREHLAPVHEWQARPRPFHCDRHTFYLDTGELPAGGYMVYRLVPETRQDRSLFFLYERIDQGSQLRDGGLAMENEYLKVSVHSDGTLDLLDKPTGRLFERMHAFEDGGEFGDYWHRTIPNHDQVVSSRGFPHRLSVVRDGALVTTIRDEFEMRVPARADRPERRRSHEFATLPIRSEVTLRAGQRRVDIRIECTNHVEDHRLRVLYPTRIQADYSDAEGHFHVDRRPIALERDSNRLGPGGMRALPQQTFVDLSDEGGGLAFLNGGLTEFEVSEDPSRTVALTLLRTAPMMICTEFRTPTIDPEQKGGQCLGPHEYRIALYPHEGDWASGRVHMQSRCFSTPVRLLQCTSHDGHLPTSTSFLSVTPSDIQVTGIKPAEDGTYGDWVVRLSNPAGTQREAVLRCRSEITGVSLARLDETVQCELTPTGPNEVRLTIEPGRIETVILKLKPFAQSDSETGP